MKPFALVDNKTVPLVGCPPMAIVISCFPGISSLGMLGASIYQVSVSAWGGHYHDDDEGQPWSVYIYIDEVATENQFDALRDIFQGKAGGNILFTNYIAEVLGVKRARIVLDHTAGKETINIGNIASVKVVKTVSFDGTVSCSIPGHDRPGKESVSSILYSDGPFEWDYQERCGFSTDFAYCR